MKLAREMTRNALERAGPWDTPQGCAAFICAL